MTTQILKITLLFAFFWSFTSLTAQDFHYAQYYNSPFLLNPALSGHISGSYRVALMHRSQRVGLSGKGNFNTPSLAFDANIDWNQGSHFGFGAALLNDRSPNGNLTNLTALAGIAFHIFLDKKNRNSLSLGYQHGIINRRINTSNLSFETTFSGGEAENFANTSLLNQESRIGVVWTLYPKKDVDNNVFKIGLAINHLIPIEEIFISDASLLETKYVIHADWERPLSKKWSITPHALFMHQATFREFLFGCMGTYFFNKENLLTMGASYRTGDAVILSTMLFLRESFKVSFSYDINLSPLTAVSNGNGGFEISFQFIGQSARSYESVAPKIRY